VSLGRTVWLLPLWGRIQGVAVGAKPLKLTAERTEGRLLNVLPFCVSSHSREAHLYLLLFMVSYRKIRYDAGFEIAERSWTRRQMK